MKQETNRNKTTFLTLNFSSIFNDILTPKLLLMLALPKAITKDNTNWFLIIYFNTNLLWLEPEISKTLCCSVSTKVRQMNQITTNQEIWEKEKRDAKGEHNTRFSEKLFHIKFQFRHINVIFQHWMVSNISQHSTS